MDSVVSAEVVQAVSFRLFGLLFFNYVAVLILINYLLGV